MEYLEKQEIVIEEDKKQNETDGYISNPFSTKDIKITPMHMALPTLITKLKYEEIDLNPDFQRHSDLWTATNMSRLIESILLKLPLPIFYFDVSNPEKWIVVDGLQRLSTIKKFGLNQSTNINAFDSKEADISGDSVKFDVENNLLLVKGAIPGPKNGYLVIKKSVKKY